MTGEKDGMVSMFDPDTWSGKTSPEPSVPTAAKTSKPSSRKSPGSSNRTTLMCLCLIRVGGLKPGASSDRWETGLLPIGSTMLNIGEFRNGENGLLSLPTSTDSRLPKFSLTLNCGEKPRVPNPTKLSEILEPSVDPKYNISAKACQGILNRAAKRGKELPKALLDALTEQAQIGKGATEIPDGSRLEMDGSEVLPAEQSVSNAEPPSEFTAEEKLAWLAYQAALTGREITQEEVESIINPPRQKTYGISSYNSEAMKSQNPECGISETDTARTVDANGASPACNQGGVAVVAAVDCRNGTENPFCERDSASEGAGAEPQQQQRCESPEPKFFQNTGVGWWNEGNAAETIRTPGGATQQKQTLSCANPYDPQAERVYHGDGAFHSLSSNSGGGRAETPSSQAVDVYNQTIDGEIAASVTAASGGTNTSGPKVMWGGSSRDNPLKREASDTQRNRPLPSAPTKTTPSAGATGIDHVLLSGGTTFQGRGWYDEVSGCLKTMPHGVMTDETDGS